MSDNSEMEEIKQRAIEKGSKFEDKLDLKPSIKSISYQSNKINPSEAENISEIVRNAQH